MTTIAKYTLVELVNKIKSKEISAVDATNAYVERIQKSKKLNAFVLALQVQKILSEEELIVS